MWGWIVRLLGGLGRVLSSTVGVVLAKLGVAVVTFTGFSVGLGNLKQQVVGWLQGMPADMVTVLALMRIDQGVLILFSALTARIALLAVDGALTRWNFRAPSGG
jgi:hypothetical protein